MKQCITIEQYNELNEKQLKRYCDFGYGQSINVGQMIELLMDCRLTDIYYSKSLLIEITKYGADIYRGGRTYAEGGDSTAEADELCDALWDAVKDLL